ncbi:hypothetical protein QYE76_036187 [Lolium multiflorum]|uniref:Retrotransposon gag domain-containing protein n=1 Tax=Lolium multiflorum TaxID=4521 RepID=A0AAD8VMW2_LOLMU|nr:hypothetical protein QYE76_036187 [Lolium multiflorum]
MDAYAYLEEPMDMAFGRFHFRVGKEGSHCLAISDSARSVAAGSDSSGSVSLFESGDEEISSTISTKLASSGELVKIFSNISVGSSPDSNISSDSDSVDTFDFIDRSTSVREVFADLYDGVTNIDDNQASTHHQVYVIGEASRAEPETSEAFDDLGNPYVDPADLTRAKLTGGTKATSMQSIQVYLSGAARSWIKKLPPGSIDSWETFENLFVKNFLSTCKKPASIEQLRACRQKYDESMRMYIQRWNIIKNSAENISDERAIDAFVGGIRRKDFIEDLGRTNPKTIAALMEIANRWADGEDAVNNKRHRSPEEDRNRNIQNRRRSLLLA